MTEITKKTIIDSTLCVSNSDAKAIDSKAIFDLHYPGIQLMEEAGLFAAQHCLKLIQDHALKHSLIFCGNGNNGGDGYVVAKHLHKWKHSVLCICLNEKKNLKGDASLAYKEMEDAGVNTLHIQKAEDISTYLKTPSLWVDAILGTGIHSEVRGLNKDVLEILKHKRGQNKILAIDIPSGIDGNNGLIRGPIIPAHRTISMGFLKWGHYLQGARLYCGNIELAQLSYPKESFDTVQIPAALCNDHLIQKKIRPLEADVHKYQNGQVIIVGGSDSMPGAALMAGKAALKSGCGMLHFFTSKDIMPALCSQLPEAIFHFRTSEDTLSENDFNAIQILSEKKGAILIGPGLGRSKNAEKLVQRCLDDLSGPFILDADALFSLDILKLKNSNKTCILTPHFGEFSRLFSVPLEELKEKPIEFALQAASESQCIIHLKSAGSLTVFPDGRVFIHSNGSPGMATAGSGDVLAGIIASFCAQGYDSEEAALIAAHIHGKAGEKSAEDLGIRSMTATSIIEKLPDVLKQFQTVSWQK